MAIKGPRRLTSGIGRIAAVVVIAVAGNLAADDSAGLSYFDPSPQPISLEFVQPADEIDELPPLAELEQLLREPVVVPTVTSASRRPEKSTAAPATVIVISKEDIRLRGYSQLIDVLRDLPGMETIEFFRSEWGAQVPVRGISGNNKIVVLVNGIRVNPPGGENFPFHNDFSVRHAERVEVVYGSGSTLYGEDAISAVINVVIQEPEDAPRLEFGSGAGVNFEREAWGWYSGELGCCRDIKVSGYVQYHDSELTPLDEEYPTYWQDFRDVAVTKTNAGGAGVVPDRNDYGLNVFGRIEWGNTSFQIWHRESEVNSAEGRTPVLGYLPQAKWRDYSTVMEGKRKRYLCDNVTLESNITYSRYEIDRDTRFVFPASATEWFLDDFKYGRGWRVGLDETLQWEVTDNFTFLAGGLIRYSNIIPKSTFNNGGFDPSRDPIAQSGEFLYSLTPGGTLISIPQASLVDYWTYATYAEAQWQAADCLRLVGGVRVTWDGHFNAVPVTPRAAVIYDVNDRVTAKYIYNRGFVQPAPYFAFAPFDNGTLLATVNPNVEPETAETHEINFEYNSENLMLGIAAYAGTQSNLITVAERAGPQNIIQDPVFRDGLAGEPRTLVQTANGGESERWGFDIYGTLDRGCISSWFSYSYVDFDETNAGMTTGLPGISKHNGRLGITCRATCNLYVTPSLVIRSTPENVVRGRLGSEIQDPWEINLYALYEYSEYMDIFLDLRNITDHHYALGGLTRNAFPQETFAGMAGIRLTY